MDFVQTSAHKVSAITVSTRRLRFSRSSSQRVPRPFCPPHSRLYASNVKMVYIYRSNSVDRSLKSRQQAASARPRALSLPNRSTSARSTSSSSTPLASPRSPKRPKLGTNPSISISTSLRQRRATSSAKHRATSRSQSSCSSLRTSSPSMVSLT